MNRIQGIVLDVKTHEGISLVKVKCGNIVFSSVIIDSPDSFDCLQTGKEVQVLFKETEVIIAGDQLFEISIQNKIPCTVSSIKRGEVLSQLNLLAEGMKITSIITSNALQQLRVKQGDKIIALIKSNEVSLSPYDRT